MKRLVFAVSVLGAILLALPGTASAQAAATATPVPGVAVGAFQGSVDWAKLAAEGDKFAYVQATIGISAKNAYFTSQYTGSHAAGLLHGATHFAVPDQSDGTKQADYFLANGGKWTGDGSTLPGVLDIEDNPYGGSACYGLSPAAMVTWLQQFVTEYHAKTSRWPVIFTDTEWWVQCTGNSSAFTANDPLWTGTGASTGSGLPGHWTSVTFYNGTTAGDAAYFNGTLPALLKLAAG